MAIEAQQNIGSEDLLEEDQYWVEVNLEGLEHTSGKRQEYWLVEIRAEQIYPEVAPNFFQITTSYSEY